MEAQIKPRFKWLKRIVILLFAALFYVVYFTPWGKPLPTNEPPMTFYNQTAVPTIFAQWWLVPTVELEWAYANQNLLQIALKIHNLETNMDPADWVCDPYIRTGKPIALRLRGRKISRLYDASGEAIQILYEYEIHASKYDFLTVEIDTTIGPCADYLNSQESSNTRPELVGNYHLSFQVPVKISTPLPPKNTPAVATWNGIPIYPKANEISNEAEFYIYTTQESAEKVESFYTHELALQGWTKFDRWKMKNNGRQEVDLYFSKSDNIIKISILLPMEDEETTVLVSLVQ